MTRNRRRINAHLPVVETLEKTTRLPNNIPYASTSVIHEITSETHDACNAGIGSDAHTGFGSVDGTGLLSSVK